MADKVTVRRLRDGDQEALASNMRMADRLECMLMAGLDAKDALDLSVRRAVAVWAVEYQGELVAIFGINRRSQTSNVGVPWLLATDRLEDMGPLFVRTSMVYAERFRRVFPKLENFVHVENQTSIDWLRWLGFAMDEPAPAGIVGEDFIRFHMETA